MLNDAQKHIKRLYEKYDMQQYAKEHGEQIIKELFTEKATSIEDDIKQVFDGGHKFLYELLQNADDVGATHVEFRLEADTLLIAHNGRQFNEHNMNRICSYGSDNTHHQDSKEKDLTKTGYKGVGFKAVFGISKRVSIISNQYCFKFEPHHWEEEQRKIEGLKYPWYIIPIELNKNELPTSIIPNESAVYFYLQEIDVDKATEELHNFFKFSEILIFLRNVNHITLTFATEKCVLHKIEKSKDPVVEIRTSQEVFSKNKNSEKSESVTQWYKYHHQFTVTADSDSFQAIKDDGACPSKIKENINSPFVLTFAAQVKNGEFTPSVEMPLFCYLPTEVETKLPFLINADFILNKERKQLSSNIWNLYLFGEIARAQFAFFADIARNDKYPSLKFDVLRLLNSPNLNDIKNTKLLKSYQKAYFEGLKSVPFVLSVDNQLLTVKASIIDDTGFFKVIQNVILQNFNHHLSENPYIDEKIASRIVSFELAHLDNLRCCTKIGNEAKKLETDKENSSQTNVTWPQVFVWDEFLNRIEEYMRKIKAFRGNLKHRNTQEKISTLLIKIIEFLIQQGETHYKTIKTKKILLTTTNSLEMPNSCFYRDNESSEAAIKFAKQYCLNQVSEIYKNLLPTLIKKQLINRLNPENIIKGFICLKIIAHKIGSQISAEDSIYWLQFIFDAYCQNARLLEQLKHELTILSEFPVLTHNKKMPLIPISDSYLENTKNDKLIEDIIISNIYFEHRNKKITANEWQDKWKNLITWLGVQTAIQLKKLSKKTYEDIWNYFQNKFGKGSIIDEYFKGILPNLVSNLPENFNKNLKKDKTNLRLKSFFTFDLLFRASRGETQSDYQISDTYVQLFLLAFTENWPKLQKSFTVEAWARGTWKSFPDFKDHFLSFYFKRYILKNDTSRQLIYSPKAAKLPGVNQIDSIKLIDLTRFGVELTLDQATFLGLRTYLSAAICFEYLIKCNEIIAEEIKKGKTPNLTLLRLLYQTLSVASAAGDILPRYTSDLRLLATDNVFQPIENLIVYDLDDRHNIPPNSKFLNDCGLTIYELTNLAKILELTLFSSEEQNLPQKMQAMDINQMSDKGKDEIQPKKDKKPKKRFPYPSSPPNSPLAKHQISLVIDGFNYSRMEVADDGDCGYTAFGITRNQAHKLLIERINEINTIIKPIVEEALLTKEFIEYLMFIGFSGSEKLVAAYNQYIQAQQTKSSDLMFYENQLKVHANNLELLKLYLDYDVKDKYVDMGWAHPLILHALANLQEIYLKLWELDADGQLIPHRHYPHNTFRNAEQTTNLLFINNNHFEFLQRIEVPKFNLNEEDDGSKTEVSKKIPQTPSTPISGNKSSFFSPSRFSPKCSGKDRQLPQLGNTPSPTNFTTKSSKKSKKSDEELAMQEAENKKLGDESERRTFLEIEKMLKENLGVEPQELTEDEIEGEGVGPGSRFIKNNCTIDLIWYNKNRGDKVVKESPVDLVIRVNNKVKYFIEVKGTASDRNPIFFLTSNEWRYMKSQRENSILVRVYDVTEDKQSRFEIYKDPFAMIFKGLINFMSGGKFCLNIKSEEELGIDHNMNGYEDKEIGCKVM